MIIKGWERLHDMHLGELIEDLNGCDIRRVPGGWIIADSVWLPSKFKAGDTYRHLLQPVFVPFSREFTLPKKSEPAPAPPTEPPAAPAPLRRERPEGYRDDDDLAPF